MNARFIPALPERYEPEARHARMAAAAQAAADRRTALSNARATYRKHEVRNYCELQQALSNICAAYVGDGWGQDCVAKVIQAISEMEDDKLESQLEPELPRQCIETAQFDALTGGDRGRG